MFVLVAGCSSTGRITSRPAERSTTSTAERADASTTSAPDPAGATGALGFTPAALRWQKCDDAPGFECTTMAVPVDWDQPAGETVDLAIARQPATGDRIGSLLTNPGGPGGSGLDYLFQEPFSGDIAKRFDIVSWDPRGVGRSSPLGCGDRVAPFLRNDPDPDTPQEQTAIDADASAVAQECADEDATMLPHIGTETVARDLDAIRAALGDDKLTYVGFSYGTSIGPQYLRLFPAQPSTWPVGSPSRRHPSTLRSPAPSAHAPHRPAAPWTIWPPPTTACASGSSGRRSPPMTAR